MYHLRLVKSLSYSGIVYATKEKPDVYVPEKDQADRLVASGYFALVSDEENTDAEIKQPAYENAGETDLFEDDEQEKGDAIMLELQKMTKDELISYAKDSGIDLTGCNKKDEIFQKIVQEIARADAARNELRGE